jgi:uncharacterized protein YdhG (YjbR/CyaY superfamily)
MKTTSKTPHDIDEYIVDFPRETRAIIKKIRSTIKKAAPGVEEAISYKMPAFRLRGHYLVHIAAYKSHIGLYPAPDSKGEFRESVKTYGSGRSTLKFPLDKPIPYPLIAKIVKSRVKENALKPAKTKK